MARYDVRLIGGVPRQVGIYDQMQRDFCRLDGELLVWDTFDGARKWLVQCFAYWRPHPEEAPSGWRPDLMDTLTQVWSMPRSEP